MADEQIYNYVRQNLRSGYSVESVKQALASRGYDASIVDQVASEMNRGARPMQQPLVANSGGILDKIKGNRLAVEIVVLVIVLLIAGYVFFV
ncbi:MAG: hypothetical protein DRN71_04645 [Candidatus Nanohalarchaeota archaeon]|nr:MAG: hypothetical protein DRN71_04645 [Candidatus Nanohaloarchaeota archaeon]